MRSIVRVGSKRKRAEADQAMVVGHAGELSSRVELIQALIPLGLEAVNELLQQEVTALAGVRYQRGGGLPGPQKQRHYTVGCRENVSTRCGRFGFTVVNSLSANPAMLRTRPIQRPALFGGAPLTRPSNRCAQRAARSARPDRGSRRGSPRDAG